MVNWLKSRWSFPKIRMKDISDITKNEDLRPYEKFEAFGPESLEDAELIAIIIKTGCKGVSSVDLARKILKGKSNEAQGLRRLMSLTEEELKEYKGVGRVKTIQLLCLGELSKRISREQARGRLDINDPKSVAKFYMELLRYKSEEEVHLMLLTTRNTFIKSVMISKGTVNSSIVSAREVFISALKYKAARMILAHNHPSGDPEPSPEDISFSQNIFKLGEIMNIHLLDSLIMGDNMYVSLKARGYLNGI